MSSPRSAFFSGRARSRRSAGLCCSASSSGGGTRGRREPGGRGSIGRTGSPCRTLRDGEAAGGEDVAGFRAVASGVAAGGAVCSAGGGVAAASARRGVSSSSASCSSRGASSRSGAGVASSAGVGDGEVRRNGAAASCASTDGPDAISERAREMRRMRFIWSQRKNARSRHRSVPACAVNTISEAAQANAEARSAFAAHLVKAAQNRWTNITTRTTRAYFKCAAPFSGSSA